MLEIEPRTFTQSCISRHFYFYFYFYFETGSHSVTELPRLGSNLQLPASVFKGTGITGIGHLAWLFLSGELNPGTELHILSPFYFEAECYLAA